jgi:hypothetical protein
MVFVVVLVLPTTKPQFGHYAASSVAFGGLFVCLLGLVFNHAARNSGCMASNGGIIN